MAYQRHVVQVIYDTLFWRRNSEIGILSNFLKILGAGPSPKQSQRSL